MRFVLILISFFLVLALLPLGYSQGGSLDVVYTDKAISSDPLSDVWSGGVPVVIDLKPQGITTPSGGKYMTLSVRGLHDGEFIGFLLEWEDDTKDVRVTGDEFRDGVALQFPLDPFVMPSAFMGPGPVNIWFWRGDWQADLEGVEYLDSEYPVYGGFDFPVEGELYVKEMGGEKVVGVSPVEDLNAEGFGSLETQSHQDVAGKGVYAGGGWRVAMVRPLVTDDEFDAQFVPGAGYKVNFAVWDGSNSDRGGRKSTTFVWKDMTISDVPVPVEAPEAFGGVLFWAVVFVLIVGVGVVIWYGVFKGRDVS